MFNVRMYILCSYTLVENFFFPGEVSRPKFGLAIETPLRAIMVFDLIHYNLYKMIRNV